MFKANVRMYPLLTTFAELKNTIFLLLFLKDTINKTLASTKDFVFFVRFLFEFEKNTILQADPQNEKSS